MPVHIPFREVCVGALAGWFGLALFCALLARHIPSETPIGPLARIFDSLAPWLLALVYVGAMSLWVLGGRKIAVALAVLATLGAIDLIRLHRAYSLPLVPEADIAARVLFFNVLHVNAAFADRIVTAVLETDADVLIFTESQSIRSALPRLAQHYNILSPCTINTCEIVVASRLPVRRHWRLSLNPIWPERYAVTELETQKGQRFFIAASHLLKPWFSGVSGSEVRKLQSQYDWLNLPVLAVGDFNAAPWARHITELMQHTGMNAARRPPGTWPITLGNWAIPIDLALVHNGARLVALTPFGDDLNSNHRGLLIDLALPAFGASQPRSTP